MSSSVFDGPFSTISSESMKQGILHLYLFLRMQLPHAYLESSAWPFEEARRLLPRLAGKELVTFESGYGASGLPHIGTFGEVVRTSFVRHAFSCLSKLPTRLLCVSDDMDGLRKIPDNIPNKEKMRPFLEHPLTAIPDPFDKFASYGEHNNHRLKTFLQEFGFDFTFISSSECYKLGMFDAALLSVLHHHQEILDVLLPTLREERQKSYSPFLPISPTSGRVLQVPILEYRESTIVFRDEDEKLVELPVTGGHCKLQWKVDWGTRWKEFSVDYEMAGKDLIDSVTLASKVCSILGGRPPETMIFEHFLDEQGRKISKSKGNGLSVEEWLRYAPVESLAYFMYLSPKRAKRLYFDSIPKSMDEYQTHLDSIHLETNLEQLKNPVWHLHAGTPPKHSSPICFSLLLNLASACHAQDKSILWGFISQVHPECSPETTPNLDQLVEYAVRYYQEIIAPSQNYRRALVQEKEALQVLSQRLMVHLKTETLISAATLQTLVYETGKEFFFQDLKGWFSCLYEVLLGQKSGPRMGSFIALYGIVPFCNLITEKLMDDPAESSLLESNF